MAINSEVDVFIFDESTHGIVVAGKEDDYEAISRLSSEGKAVLFISSEFPELLRVSDRIVVVSNGTTVDELHSHEANEESLLELCYKA